MRPSLWLLLVASGCSQYPAPEGFAPFDERREPFRAVSPEGVVYRVRTLENSPPADLAFWREAMKKRMSDAGYVVQKDGEVEASGDKGYLLELAAPLGTRDYAYLVALFVRGDELVIVEAAGEVVKLTARRDAILGAIRAL
jgi:hypothetical protein